MLESDLLNNMEGIRTRWSDPLVIRYPKYVTWFDFPYSIWVGPETTAAEKNAALQFQQYLLSPEMQKLAVQEGLRPVTNDVNVTEGDTLFTQVGRVRASRRSCRARPAWRRPAVTCCWPCCAGSI